MGNEPEFDQNLILTFLFQISRFEGMLKHAGFKKSHSPTQADWASFLSEIEEKFDPKTSVELQGAIAFLLDWEIQHTGKKMYHPSLIHLLAGQIQEQRDALLHGINFHPPTSEEYNRMMAGLVVLAAWFDLIELK